MLIAGTVAVFMIANEYNSLPFFVDQMPTSSPIPQSVLMGLLQGLGAGVGIFLYMILAAGAGEPLYRADFPARLSLRSAFTARGVRTKEFFRATVVGYGFAAFHIAFVCLFYVLGRRFGVWSPQDVAYSDLLLTALPWIYPLTISLMAASSEEFWFRLFAIPLLRRVMPIWLAVIIPAFVWGFLHANYPQQPGYIRGIEVGVIGVAAGFLMLRFGILATLIWHYTVDAVLIGTFLFQSQSLYFKLSGALVSGVVLLPLIVSLVAYRRQGGFVSDESLLNRAIPAPIEPVLEVVPDPLPPVTPAWRVRWLYVAAAVALACALLIHTQPFGDFIRVRLSREQAARVADDEMRKRGLDPEQWRKVTSFAANLNSSEFEYLRRNSDVHTANRTVENSKATAIWLMRYFRDQQKEEWRVYVDQRGVVYRVDHMLDEKAPGANLSQAEARQVAEKVLQDANWRLVDAQQEKRDKRTDHSFVFEDPTRGVADAKARVTVDVIGNELSGYRRFLKLPEEWLRDFEKPRLQRLLLPGMIGAFLLPLTLALIRRVASGKHRFAWRTYTLFGVAGMALAIASDLNRMPQLLSSYNTATPLNDFQVRAVLTAAMGVVLFGSGRIHRSIECRCLPQTNRRGPASARG